MGLQLINIFKSYTFGKNKQRVLNNLTIKFPRQGLVAIIGKSGTGKSTLLNIIAGIEKPDGGKVMIDGHSLDYREIANYQSHYISYVYQFYNLIPALTVKQNLMIITAIKGVDFKTIETKMIDYSYKLQINHLLDSYPDELSGGQKQRVGLLRAFLGNTPILLADEPTGALNYHQSQQVMNLLKDYARNHLVIVISHNRSLIKKYTTLIVDLDDNQDFYDFKINKYHKYSTQYPPKQSKRLFFYIKQQIRYQKAKLVMMFISQLFIILAFVLLLSACTGGWQFLESRFQSDPLKNIIEVYQSDYNVANFSDRAIKKFKENKSIESVSYKLDFNRGYFNDLQLTGYQMTKSYELDYQAGKYPKSTNQVLINQDAASQYDLKIGDSLEFVFNEITYSFTITGIINDYVNQGDNFYVDVNYLQVDLREALETEDILILESNNVKQVINDHKDDYLMVSYHLEYIESYQLLFDLAQMVVMIFIVISFMISMILISIILKTIFIERKRDTSLLLANGMKKVQIINLFSLEATIIGFFIGLFGSVFSLIVLKLLAIFKISEKLFNISNLFVLPGDFFMSLDLYGLLIGIYMLVCYFAGLQAAIKINKMDVSILLKEN